MYTSTRSEAERVVDCRLRDSEVYSAANLRAISVGNHHMAAPSHFCPAL